ncbi:lysosome-associated membrane glycoprotein 2-like [Anneissia japonica]|uniref:lysosome-associated membrane glycoprotein 2-like n=1 Tax=Anneissia japonica TaxID=1529436 RepID=UPI0014257911|nr:lysosome-associated membrane glycoprotein 2-like [Anneissia japonica]
MMRQLIAVLSFALLACGAMAGSWEVMTDNKACILLEMNLTFAVQYTTNKESVKEATFDLSSNATVDDSSKCGKDVANIKLNFLTDYSIMFEFQSKEQSYNLQSVAFDYVLDEENFPNANIPNQGISLKGDIIQFTTPIGYSYRCNAVVNDKSIEGLMLTFSDVKLQPFGVADGKFSKENVCDADKGRTTVPTTIVPMTTPNVTVNMTTVPMTTAASTTVNMTTASNTTGNTTEIMTTMINDSTTVEPTTVPSTTKSPPTVGNWTVKDGNKTCMNMAFKANFSILITDKNNKTVFHNGTLPPNADPSRSMCNESSSTFRLLYNNSIVIAMEMVFEKTTDKNYGKSKLNAFEMNEFYLYYILDGNVEDASTNHTYFHTHVNKTYQCNANQVVKAGNANVTFSEVKLQPFADGANYPGEVDDCKADDSSSNIVPIAVGCALAGLVIIVLIAYLIGRKRTKNVGYQTV